MTVFIKWNSPHYDDREAIIFFNKKAIIAKLWCFLCYQLLNKLQRGHEIRHLCDVTPLYTYLQQYIDIYVYILPINRKDVRNKFTLSLSLENKTFFFIQFLLQ